MKFKKNATLYLYIQDLKNTHLLNWRWADFFYKGTDSEYFKLCELHPISVTQVLLPFFFFYNLIKI